MSECPFNVEPFSQSGPLAAPNVVNLNYTNQDFWSMKSRLIDFIKSNFPNDFNDFVESSLAIMLIENWAFIADTLSFKIDQIANEVFIDTVTEVENAFRLAKLVGFNPQPPIAARSMWSATLNNPVLADVTIPAPFDVTVTAGNESISIELFPADADGNPIYDQDILIPAGTVVNNSVVGLEGFTYTDTFPGTGLVGQTYTLSYFPVIFDSIRVDVDGVRWTQVEQFTDSQPRREYRVEFNSLWHAFIIFGNNRAGLIPSQGSQIVVTYRKGGGTVGNIVTQSITSETVVPLPGFEYSVPVGLSNYTQGQFGYDGDTVDDVRSKLPAWLALQNRCVTGSDYKTFADQFASPYQGQTGKSTAVLRNQGCAANVIDLYVLVRGTTPSSANDLQLASSQFKAELGDAISQVQMFTDFVCIKDGSILLVDVSIDVVMNKFYKKFEDQYRTMVTQKVASFFSLPNWEYGKSLRQEDLGKQLSTIREVNRFEMNFMTNDPENSGVLVTANYKQIIRPDTITVTFVYE
jgi:hypothetical protein